MKNLASAMPHCSCCALDSAASSALGLVMQLVTCNAGADCALRPQTNLIREVQLLTVNAATPQVKQTQMHHGCFSSMLMFRHKVEPHEGCYPTCIVLGPCLTCALRTQEANKTGTADKKLT